MGLFGGKEVHVASTVYNMAGPVEERIDYLKSLVGSNVITSSQFSMSETLSAGYMNGPGIKARSLYRWAANNYQDIGLCYADVGESTLAGKATIEAEIPHEATQDVDAQDVEHGPAQYAYWAEQWMMENRKTELNTAWTSDIDPATNQITITLADNSTVQFIADIDPTADYLYITYMLSSSGVVIGTRLYIYKIGSGNATLDGLPATRQVVEDGFLPFIPIRIENEFLSENHMADAFAEAKRCYKKATTKKFSEIVEKIADNESLGDIDHAYMVYGVALNTQDNAGRKYLYEFFHNMMVRQGHLEADYLAWRDELASYSSSRMTYDTQVYEEQITNVPGETLVPPPYYPPRPGSNIIIKPNGPIDLPMEMRMYWGVISETTGTGLKKPGAKTGELWFTIGSVYDNDGATVYTGNSNDIVPYSKAEDSKVELHWQLDQNSWKTLTIIGLRHRNMIYKSKSVDISAKEALEDVEESGFIVPLHYGTLKEMSLIDSTQLMTAGAFIVFNSYEVVKQRWYQTGIFKIFIFVVMIAITVATMGAAAPGLLGAAGAVGASLGFTGLAAVIVGAVANAVAAMLLMELITRASVMIFGDKLGTIIATIASAVAMQFGSSLMSGQTLATAWGNMSNVLNILQLTSAVGNGIAGYIQASTVELLQKTQDVQEEYQKSAAKIQQMLIEQFGYGKFEFDPNMLTNNNPYGLVESPQSFLDRTLMTGVDIAEMTNGMVSDFASLTLDVSTIGR